MDKFITLFSRTSTTQQDVEQQTTSLIEEAKRLGYDESHQIIVEYQESGTKLGIETRQGIQKLKEVIATNSNVDCVICWELTRIARRADVIYNIRDFLLDHKVRWIVCKPYMELIDRDGKVTQVSSLMLGIFSSFAESEMMIKNERFSRAREDMRRESKKFGGATIFGYMKDQDKHIVLHPLHSKIVAEIFSHYAEDDESYHSTYTWMMSKWPDLFPELPYKKAQRRVSHFLETRVYWEGNWCYPNIVTESLYMRVREKAKNARCVPRFERSGQWLGRGKMVCAHCGHVLVPVGGSTNAYNCPTDKMHNMTINADIAEWMIWEEAKVIANIQASIDNKEAILRANEKMRESEALIEQYSKSLSDCESKQSKLVELYIDGKITKDMFDVKNSDITSRIDDLKKKTDNARASLNELKMVLDRSQSIVEVKSVNYDSITNFDTKLDIVRKTIDKIVCTKTDKMEYLMEFHYKGAVVPQSGKYRYLAKGGIKKLFRINDDGTEDLVYEKQRKNRGKDGKYVKSSE